MTRAYKQVWKSVTGVPAADLSAKRYTFVTFDANGKVVTPAAGAKVVGVLEEGRNVDQPSQVVAQGFMFVKLGAALSAGAVVMTDANGEAVAYADATAPAVNYPAGILHVGGAVGDIGTILLG